LLPSPSSRAAAYVVRRVRRHGASQEFPVGRLVISSPAAAYVVRRGRRHGASEAFPVGRLAIRPKGRPRGGLPPRRIPTHVPAGLHSAPMKAPVAHPGGTRREP